jgi:glycosyltransferase involved in cell wall biosynthesis
MTADRVGIDYRPALVNREGIGRYARELVRALIEQGAAGRLHLFASTLAAPRFSPDELGLARASVHSVRLRLPSRWLGPLMRASGRGADDWLGGVDVFHHTQPSPLPVRRAVQVATIFDCLYLDGRGFVDAASAARMERAARELVRDSRLVLVPSAFVAEEVARRLGARPDRIVVTELGCDHALHVRPANVLPAHSPYLLTVARVDARKNHVRMLAAFEELAARGLPHRWIVAGPRGHGFAEFEAALARSPARPRVEWREYVGEGELAALYDSAAAFVFASLGEGFGLPPLEAMTHGVPVVTSDVSCLPEICGDAAVLVDPEDAHAIAAGIERALADPSLPERGRARAARYTWRECARRTLAAYERALG